MDLYSDFCNICYKTCNGTLIDISEDSMKHLKDTLIKFVGHADILNRDIINLCQLCCEEVIRSNKFRDKCFTNLIQLRQSVFEMKCKLELEGEVCSVKNTLKIFVHEVLRRKILEKNNSPVSIPTENEIVKISADLRKTNSDFNIQAINLQLHRNECDIFDIDNVSKCDEPQIAFTNNDDMKNEIITRSEDIKSEIFESEYDKDFVASNINYYSERDISKIEFTKEEFDPKCERNSGDSEHFTLKNYDNEPDEYANFDVKMNFVNNSADNVNSEMNSMKEELQVKQEDSVSECVELETIENEFVDGPNVGFNIANVCTIMNVEDCEHEDIRSDNGQVESRGCNNKSPAAITNMQSSHPHGREHDTERCPTALQSGVNKWIYYGTDSSVTTACNKSSRTTSPYKCTVCNKVFAKPSDLTKHKSLHTGERPYKCTVCNKAFTVLSNLTAHEGTHSRGRPYKCIVCNKSFTVLRNLTEHERTHSGVRPHKCSVCNKGFTRSSDLTKHKRIHSGDRPYNCADCNKTFTVLSNLITHKRTHSGEKPYKCNVCNKAFANSGNLVVHERTHSGYKPYKCTVCNKMFTASSDLTRHKRTHSGGRPYKCTFCNKAFTQSFNLTVHKRVHSRDPAIQFI